MKPIGLTFKDIKPNPYTGRASGELMIVHLCLNCGKISCNRIAGDDNPYTITCLLAEATNLDRGIINRLVSQGIKLLNQDDKPEVLVALYGYDYQKYLK